MLRDPNKKSLEEIFSGPKKEAKASFTPGRITEAEKEMIKEKVGPTPLAPAFISRAFKAGKEIAKSTAAQAEQTQLDIEQRRERGDIGFGGEFIRQFAVAPQKTLGPLAAVTGGVAEAAGITDIVGKGLEGGEKVLDVTTKPLQNLIEKVVGREKLDEFANNVTKGIDTPEFRADFQNVMNAIGSTSVIFDALSGGALLGGLKAASKKGLFDSLEKNARDSIQDLIDLGERQQASKLALQKEKGTEAAGKILQAKSKDIPAAERVLPKVDTEGVTTFKELQPKLKEYISNASRQVDEALLTDTKIYKPDDFKQTITVADRSVEKDYLQQALDQLEEAYTKSDDVEAALRIQAMKDDYVANGINLKQANDIAREYGTEFKRKAFTKAGEPTTSINNQQYENTRKAVKEVVREKFEDPIIKELDQSMSDAFRVESLISKNVDKVNALKQKFMKRKLGDKVGALVTDVADTLTGGVLKGAMRRLYPSNIGQKTANFADIERQLEKNLRLLDAAASETTKKGIVEKLGDILKQNELGVIE